MHRRRPDGADRRADPAARHARLRGQRHRQVAPAAACCRPAGRRRRTGSGTAGAASCSAGRGSPAPWPCSSSSRWPSRCSACGSPSPTPATTRPPSPPARPTTSWRRGSAPASTDRWSSRPTCTAPPPRRRPLSTTSNRPSRPIVDGIAFVTPAEFNAAHTGAVIVVYPTTSPQSPQTETLVQTLRNDVIPPVVERDRRGRAGRRADGGEHRCRQLPRPPALRGDRRRPDPVVPAPHGRVPLAGAPAQGGHHEPAQRRRGLRRDGGGLPVGLGRARHRHRRDGADRPVDPGGALRGPLRPLHGLRGLPALPHPRGVVAHARQLAGRGGRPRRDRAASSPRRRPSCSASSPRS